MAKKKKGNKKNSSKKTASSPQKARATEQQELPNIPNQALVDFVQGLAGRASSGETVGVLTIEFDANRQKRFGWSGQTPRPDVVEAAEIVKQFFLLDEVVAMRQNLTNQRKAAQGASKSDKEVAK